MPRATGTPADTVGLPGTTTAAWVRLPGGRAIPAVPLAAEAEEAILTVGILRQMLAGAARSIRPVTGLLPPDDRATGQPLGECPAAVPSVPGPLGSAYAAIPAVAVDAMEDMAQLERLVNRLAGEPRQRRRSSAWRAPVQLAQPIYTVPFVAPTESPAVAADVVANMMATLAQDARLLPPMQLAVKKLEEAAQTIGRALTLVSSRMQAIRRGACWMRSRSAVWRSLPKMRRALPSFCAW